MLNSLCSKVTGLVSCKENEEENFENKNIMDAVSVSRLLVSFFPVSEKGKSKDCYKRRKLLIVVNKMSYSLCYCMR
jgi:hypothetical protein